MLQETDRCNSSFIYMYEGLPMNNSIITVNKVVCSEDWFGPNSSPHEYKTVLDIVYMLGTCVGGEVFHKIGETYGLRFSLGFALFTTFLGSSLGATSDITWLVGLCSKRVELCLYLYCFPGSICWPDSSLGLEA